MRIEFKDVALDDGKDTIFILQGHDAIHIPREGESLILSHIDPVKYMGAGRYIVVLVSYHINMLYDPDDRKRRLEALVDTVHIYVREKDAKDL